MQRLPDPALRAAAAVPNRGASMPHSNTVGEVK
jgi:hypothetical protein